MEFYNIPDNRLGVREIPPLLAGLLRQIPGLFEGIALGSRTGFFPVPRRILGRRDFARIGKHMWSPSCTHSFSRGASSRRG